MNNFTCSSSSFDDKFAAIFSSQFRFGDALADQSLVLIDLATNQRLPRDSASDKNPEKCRQSTDQVISKSRSTTCAALKHADQFTGVSR
jgi:hypothetical protein